MTPGAPPPPPTPTALTSDLLNAGEALRRVMRRVPSPVTVVTAAWDGERYGATIGSFTSVSLAPPLVSFNLQHGSSLRTVLEAGAPFAVHVLRDDQADLAARFARPDLAMPERFDGLTQDDEDGVPVLPCLARIRGLVHTRVAAGDHLLVLADVVGADVPGEGEPLLYLDRAFRRVG